MAEIELDGLEESLVLRMFTQQRLRVGPVLTVHRVQLELLRLNKTNKQLNKHIHTIVMTVFVCVSFQKYSREIEHNACYYRGQVGMTNSQTE